MQAARKILRLKKNTAGRDFVIGDIHGAYDLVIEAMRQVGFNRQTDRLFSVGDLVDRGPESHRCLKFLQQPYVYAVRGNHEQMLLDIHANGEPPEAMVQWLKRNNGFGWWEGVEPAMRTQIVESFSQLPLVIEIETARGIVGLLHAEVPRGMDWPTFIAKIEAGDQEATESCLEGRERYKAKDETGVPGIGRIFVGHTVHWAGATRYGNVYSIDTGAIFGQLGIKDKGGLTLAALAAGTGLLAGPTAAQGLVDLRVHSDADTPERPFGQYAAPGG
jgi:serine/threonine protein phosphatase 1